MATTAESTLGVARRVLVEAGYPYVEAEPATRNRRSGFSPIERAYEIALRADLVAWGPDEGGQLVPLVLVEVVSTTDSAKLEGALGQLAAINSRIGAPTCLVATPDSWYEANRGFTRLEEIAAPPQCPDGPAKVDDVSIATELLLSVAWATADRQRDVRVPGIETVLPFLHSARRSGDDITFHQGSARIRFSPIAFTQAWYHVASAIDSRRESLEFVSPPDLVEVLASIGWAGRSQGDSVTILDPFVGYGGLLTAATLAASGFARRFNAVGFDVNPEAALAVERVFELIGVDATIHNSDSLSTPWPKVDLVISTPPLGLRTTNLTETPIGRVREVDVATIARAASVLKPGGRAVLVTTRTWTFSTRKAAGLREYLAQGFRVRALLGLPAIYSGTSVQLLLTVIDQGTPGPTVVGDLGNDWLESLSPGGFAYEAIAESTRSGVVK